MQLVYLWLVIVNYQVCFTFQRLQEIEHLADAEKINVVKDNLVEEESSSGYDSETSQSDLFTSEYL
jgi:hypothetical protein